MRDNGDAVPAQKFKNKGIGSGFLLPRDRERGGFCDEW